MTRPNRDIFLRDYGLVELSVRSVVFCFDTACKDSLVEIKRV